MKLTKSESGMAPVAMVIILVILGIIGFAGWKVYNSRYQKSTWEDVAVTQNSLENQTPSVIPEGFIEYKNQEFGFKFVYPKDWGDVVAEDDRLLKQDQGADNGGLKADTGKRWLLKFTNESKATLGLASIDWATQVGRGGPCTIASGSRFGNLASLKDENNDVTVTKLLSIQDKYAVVEIASMGMCTNVVVTFDHILNSSTYKNVTLLYNSFDFNNEQEFADYRKNSNKYVDPTLATTIEKIAQSVQDL